MPRLDVTCHAYSMRIRHASHKMRLQWRSTQHNIQTARTECVRSRSIAHSQNRARARGDERDGVLSLRGHGQRRVVRDGATCVVRAIDGDRGGARDSSRLITVCGVSPPLRSAFLQLMTLRSTSSNPYHFNFFFVRFFFVARVPYFAATLLLVYVGCATPARQKAGYDQVMT